MPDPNLPVSLAGLWASLSGGIGRMGSAVQDLSRLQLPAFPAPLWLMLSPPQFPSKKRLMTVYEFFQYSEREGKAFFESLDSGSKGYVTVKDLRRALSARNLPPTYATALIQRARGSKWWLQNLTWEQFKGLLDERDSEILQAFTSLELSAEGSLHTAGLKESLRKMGLPASDTVAAAMLRAIGSEEDGAVSYGRFRNFMVLLPPQKDANEQLPLDWYHSATMLPLGPPEPPPPSPPGDHNGALRSILMATLAGGLASASTTLVLHPIDTLKTRVQSLPGAALRDVPSWLPQLGVRGVYRGIVPATTGSFLGHGLRTGGYETALRLLSSVAAPGMELQMQGLASGVGTVVGTATRIPCELLKQRLQIGLHPNAPHALAAALKADGVSGLFRGTSATLLREVPFYMLGMVLYQQLKHLADGSAFGHRARQLSRREIIAMGTLAGALSAIATTPADVLKTRIMTAGAGSKVTVLGALTLVLREGGPRALFKGALARSVWTMPAGAVNFAGYELARQALMGQGPEDTAGAAPGAPVVQSAGGEEPRSALGQGQGAGRRQRQHAPCIEDVAQPLTVA